MRVSAVTFTSPPLVIRPPRWALTAFSNSRMLPAPPAATVPPVTPKVAASRNISSMLSASTVMDFSACTSLSPPSRMAETCFSKRMVTTVPPRDAVALPEAERAPPKFTTKVSSFASTSISPSS